MNVKIDKNKTEDTKNKTKRFFLFEKPAIDGLFLSLFGIYAVTMTTEFLNISFSPISFFAGIGMIAATVWTAGAVRKIAKYGLGTGVPSVGMIGIGLATVIFLFSILFGPFWGPVIAAVLSLTIGWLCGKLINTVIEMNIPSMENRMAEITAGCTLAMTASAAVVVGTMRPETIFNGYVFSGIIALGFIGCSLAAFHAYNANLGPDEKHDRTQMLSILDGSMLLLILGIAAFFLQAGSTYGSLIGPAVTIFISVVFVFISYYKYWNYVKRDAWKIEKTGLLPSEEELN